MKYFTHWILAFVTLTLLMVWGFSDPYVKKLARLKSFDVVQQYDTPTISNDIVIVEIDERAIEQYGQWPWNRKTIADIIWQLRQAGAGIIVLPVLFSEPDRLGGDNELVFALNQNGVVIAQVGTAQGVDKNSVPRGVAKIGDPIPYLFNWPGMLGPIEILGQNADGVGVINTAPEIDETIRVATGAPSYQVKAGPSGVQAVRVPGYPVIKTDPNGQIWLRWNKQFERISVVDKFDIVQGKTVILGITAEGIGSVIATPNGERYSHDPIAVGLQTIISGDNIVRTDYATFVEYVTAGVVALLLVLLATFAPYWLVGIAFVVFWTGTGYASYFAFTRHLQLWDVSWILLVASLTGFHAVFNRFAKEFFEKQAIKKQFAGYCSPTVVKMLQENPKLIKEGTKREISICFSDLRGFTPLGESFGDDVKGLTQIMNGYMDAITKPILDANGMVIKYIGDASMHIHNAPIDDKEHHKTAVQTGLEMLKAVEKFNEKITAEGRPPVGMGAGINSGLGYLGEMGSTERHSYDVLGDSVSTAARIESKCKEYGCVLLVGENTYDATKDDFMYLKIDELAVKGKSVGIRIYTVLSDMEYAWNNTDWPAMAQQHEKMHECYRSQLFNEAIRLCNILKNEFGGQMEKYYDMWIERCEYMKTQDLPEDWNGVFVATTK